MIYFPLIPVYHTLEINFQDLSVNFIFLKSSIERLIENFKHFDKELIKFTMQKDLSFQWNLN